MSDSEIDNQIAVRVIGTFRDTGFHPTEFIVDAWKALAKMREAGWEYELSSGLLDDGSRPHGAVFWKAPNPERGILCHDTHAARAISLAIMAAIAADAPQAQEPTNGAPQK